MADADAATIAAWAALGAAVLALVVALAQAVQQYVATAQNMRKCEKSVWGPMPGHPGRRVWVWSQLRFRIVFDMPNIFIPTEYWHSHGNARQFPAHRITALPAPFDPPSAANADPEGAAPQSHSEACWVAFARQVSYVCPAAIRVGLMAGDVDRLPADLPVVPMQVSIRDTIAMGLMIGMSLQIARGDLIEMSGPSGFIKSSDHPLLGRLLHFSAFSAAPRSTLKGLLKGDISRSWLRRLEGIASVANQEYDAPKRKYYELLGMRWRTYANQLPHIREHGTDDEVEEASGVILLTFVDLQGKEHSVPADKCETWEAMLQTLESENIATVPYIIRGPENKRVAPRSWKTLLKVIRKGDLITTFRIAQGDYIGERAATTPVPAPSDSGQPQEGEQVPSATANEDGGAGVDGDIPLVDLQKGKGKAPETLETETPDKERTEEPPIAFSSRDDQTAHSNPTAEPGPASPVPPTRRRTRESMPTPKPPPAITVTVPSAKPAPPSRRPTLGGPRVDNEKALVLFSTRRVRVDESTSDSESDWDSESTHESIIVGRRPRPRIPPRARPRIPPPARTGRKALPRALLGYGSQSPSSSSSSPQSRSRRRRSRSPPHPPPGPPPPQYSYSSDEYDYGRGYRRRRERGPVFDSEEYWRAKQANMYVGARSAWEYPTAPVLSFYWAAQLDVELGYWATPWRDGLFSTCADALPMMVDVALAGLARTVRTARVAEAKRNKKARAKPDNKAGGGNDEQQPEPPADEATPKVKKSATDIQYAHFHGSVVLDDLWVHLRQGGHTWPPYATNPRGGMADIAASAPAVQFAAFPAGETLPPLVLLQSVHDAHMSGGGNATSTSTSAPGETDKVAVPRQSLLRDRILELASLDLWLTRAAAAHSIDEGETHLGAGTAAAIVEEIWLEFGSEMMETREDRWTWGRDGGDAAARALARRIGEYLAAFLTSEAETYFVWVAFLRAVKLMECVADGPNTWPALGLFEDDVLVYLV